MPSFPRPTFAKIIQCKSELDFDSMSFKSSAVGLCQQVLIYVDIFANPGDTNIEASAVSDVAT